MLSRINHFKVIVNPVVTCACTGLQRPVVNKAKRESTKQILENNIVYVLIKKISLTCFEFVPANGEEGIIQNYISYMPIWLNI